MRGACANCGDASNSLGWPDWRPIVDFERLRAGVKQCICSSCFERLRAAHAGPKPCELDPDGDFCIIHSCVDGAGTGPSFRRKADAIAYAEWLQRRTDATGNPWLFRYTVYGPNGEVHGTTFDRRVFEPAKAVP